MRFARVPLFSAEALSHFGRNRPSGALRARDLWLLLETHFYDRGPCRRG